MKNASILLPTPPTNTTYSTLLPTLTLTFTYYYPTTNLPTLYLQLTSNSLISTLNLPLIYQLTYKLPSLFTT